MTIRKFSLYWWAFEEITCGCGDPAGVIGLLHDHLRALRNWKEDEDEKDWSIEYIERRNERVEELSPGLNTWLIWNWMDNLELIEHGYMLPGWVTSFGRRVLVALDEDEYTTERGGRSYHFLDDDHRHPQGEEYLSGDWSANSGAEHG